MDASHLKEMKALQEENRRLEQMYAELNEMARIRWSTMVQPPEYETFNNMCRGSFVFGQWVVG